MVPFLLAVCRRFDFVFDFAWDDFCEVLHRCIRDKRANHGSQGPVNWVVSEDCLHFRHVPEDIPRSENFPRSEGYFHGESHMAHGTDNSLPNNWPTRRSLRDLLAPVEERVIPDLRNFPPLQFRLSLRGHTGKDDKS